MKMFFISAQAPWNCSGIIYVKIIQGLYSLFGCFPFSAYVAGGESQQYFRATMNK